MPLSESWSRLRAAPVSSRRPALTGSRRNAAIRRLELGSASAGEAGGSGRTAQALAASRLSRIPTPMDLSPPIDCHISAFSAQGGRRSVTRFQGPLTDFSQDANRSAFAGRSENSFRLPIRENRSEAQVGSPRPSSVSPEAVPGHRRFTGGHRARSGPSSASAAFETWAHSPLRSWAPPAHLRGLRARASSPR
jgi:hypothetical protein